MSEWLTPEGVTAIVLLVTTLLGFAGALFERAGKKEWAEKARAAEAHAATAAKVAGSVVGAVERVKREGRLAPRDLAQVVEALRQENTAAGVEDVVRPALAQVRDGEAPERAVRSVVAARVRRVS